MESSTTIETLLRKHQQEAIDIIFVSLQANLTRAVIHMVPGSEKSQALIKLCQHLINTLDIQDLIVVDLRRLVELLPSLIKDNLPDSGLFFIQHFLYVGKLPSSNYIGGIDELCRGYNLLFRATVSNNSKRQNDSGTRRMRII